MADHVHHDVRREKLAEVSRSHGSSSSDQWELPLTSIELFAGSGGLALGVARAGFEHLALNELDPFACQTLRANGVWKVLESDSHHVDWSPFHGRVGLLAGGAPCQPFSIGGLAMGDEDTRNLFPEVVRAVRQVEPHAVLLENVRGLGRPAFREYLHYILKWLQVPHIGPRPGEEWQRHLARVCKAVTAGEALYHLYGPQVIDSADFGAPQNRQRLFVVALRADLIAPDAWRWPIPTHTREALVWEQLQGSYWRDHKLLRRDPPEGRLRCTKALRDRLAKCERPSGERWVTVRDTLADLPDPGSPAARHIDGHVYVPTRAVTYHGHTGNLLDWPAKTVKAGVHGVPGGEGIVRFDNERARRLTIRETARLQTFPDEWHFVGPRSRALRQLGNAVSVVVAEALAKAIRTTLDFGTPSTETPDD